MGTFSQKGELIALAGERQIAKNQWANIYTDFEYVFLIAHMHSALWKKRSLLTTKGKPIVNDPLISKL